MKRLLLIISLASLACGTSSVLANQLPTVTPTQTAPLPTLQPLAVRKATVTADEALNVRTGPAVTYPTTSYLLAGWRVEIVSDCVSGWVQVEYDGKRGWVNADYLNDGSVCE